MNGTNKDFNLPEFIVHFELNYLHCLHLGIQGEMQHVLLAASILQLMLSPQ